MSYPEVDLTAEWIQILSDRTPPDVFSLLGQAADGAHQSDPGISPDAAMLVAWHVWDKLVGNPDSAIMGLVAMVAAGAVDDALNLHQETVGELRARHLEEGARRIEDRANADRDDLERRDRYDPSDEDTYQDRFAMASLVRGRQDP